MKVLVKNESICYSSEVVTYGGNKFKIVAKNGNCYCDTEVYVFTKNGDLALIAVRADIPNAIYVDYIRDDNKRKAGNAKNLIAAENYIKAVYKDC